MTSRINQVLSGMAIGGSIGVGLGTALQNWTVGSLIGLGLSAMWVVVFIGASHDLD